MAKDPYKYFRVEARDLADQLGQGLLELERTGSGEIVPRLLRLAHTLKGAARVVRQPEIAEHAHAIEGALSPFRELAGMVPRENVDGILRLIDAIAHRVAALQAPVAEGSAEPAAASAAPAKTVAAEEPYQSARADVEEIDQILDGVTEAYTQMNALREAGGVAERARRLADLLVEQNVVARKNDGPGPGRAGRFAASTEQLRGLIQQLERSIAGVHERVDRELRQMRDATEQLRLVPAKALFANFERTARDAARTLGKDVVFEARGGDIRLDARVVRVVQDAMIQLIRNAVAHGIETRDQRAAAGKPPRGRVEIAVSRSGRQVTFRCTDDGRGIDVNALREAAIRKGRPAAELDRMDANEVTRLLLQGSGLSTAATLSDIAGRGIGMDIVREAIARLSGELVSSTEPGKGTSFELVVPLSISSVEALVVEGGGITATIPLSAVRHTLRLEAGEIYKTSFGDAIFYDGRATPLASLAELLGRGGASRRRESVTVVAVAGTTGAAAIAVDRLLGTSNIVFRSLPDLAPASGIVAGASFDADGSPLLMLDPEGLVEMVFGLENSAPAAEPRQRPLLVIDDSLTTRMLEQSILESAGYQVDVATSAEEGLAQAQRGDYALILVDVEMPGMDGFSFIEQIRADPKLRDIPALLVTSRNAPEDKRRGYDVGAQGYVVKSEFNQAELLAHIKELVA